MTAYTPIEVLDVRVTLPEHWWPIPLVSDEAMRVGVREIVHDEFGGIEDHPLLQSELRRNLLAQAEAARAVEGRLLALCRMWADDGTPVAASLVLTWVDLPRGDGPGAMLMDLKQRIHPRPEEGRLPAGHALDLGKLPPGQAVRYVHLEDAPLGTADDPPIRSLVADYWLERPDGAGVVQFAFSSPILPLRETWLELWDAIVGALRWVTAEDAARESVIA